MLSHDFLHHGKLPFVGREAELGRLLEFWRATPYSQRLRASLVQAEAGIGKSRLLEEVMRRIQEEEGVVVHAKLYPESSVSLAPLLARALWHSSVGRELLRTEPEETLPSVIGALRRLGRLRPTLLVLEDTHLLASESVPELSALLNALADETIAVLALCRPSEWRGRTVLESFLVERLELEGLAPEAIGEIWEQLFGTRCEPAVAAMLHRATLGNALALRSGLRSAVESRMIVPAGDAWRLSDPTGTFASLMQRNVELLSAGMVAHLGDDELRTATSLASLGEVFSREAAYALIGENAEAIEALTARGVLATTTMLPPPLGGLPPRPGAAPGVAPGVAPGGASNTTFPSSAHPLLVFTHTLLHKHLADRARVDPAGLARVVTDGHPLYSLLPLILLERHAARLAGLGTDILRTAMERSLYIAWLLDQGFDPRAGMKAWETASAMLAVFRNDLPNEERERQELRLMQINVSLLRFTADGRLNESARQFHEATLRSGIPDINPFRFSALGAYVGTHRDSETIYIEVWRELEQIVEASPGHRTHRSYIKCLGAIAQAAAIHADHAILSALRDRTEEILRGVPPEHRLFIEWIVYPPFLAIYNTAGELEDRTQLYRRLEGEGPHEGKLMGMYRISFLVHIGEMDAALEAAEEVLRWYAEQGIWESAVRASMDVMVAHGTLGRDLATIETRLRELLEEIPYRDAETLLTAGLWSAVVGLLRGEPEWGWRLFHELAPGTDVLPPEAALAAIALGDIDAAARTFAGGWTRQPILNREVFRALSTLVAFARGDRDDTGQAVTLAAGLLRTPVLHLYDILTTSAVLTILEMIKASPSGAETHAEVPYDMLREPARDALVAALEWLAQRELPAVMAPLVARFGEHLNPGELAAWNTSITALRSKHDAHAKPAPGAGNVRVSMLGTIQVGASGGAIAPLRGVRIRTLLGLMVADQMIGASLTPQEFVLLAGEDDDPELARKKRNMGVVRLREIMGADAILTDGRTPRLNPDLVEVDLLRADELVKRSLAAAREGAWVRAHPLLLEALELTRGEVPFPTLYESFFEAARDDFEYRVRAAVLDVSRGLLREGDSGGAEDILRRAYTAMPDDEEIAELFEQALISRGNRTEAARVRMRSGEGVG